ncbi:STAS-like domain-containing protein [Gallaecimonas pentaromativorans]|uniref:Uncharacterized protein DUF4325 n=1 Tax=Gallaecimonas pentaromativorans TaxID=584787 RepID=A0A3N1NWX7_9GAMM|nr:STAS-like domain-containing protein [Gallaecimonas pentaromativorans]ROQ24334.1 uncharacterized protein DUF4325 [Gallaecimonas pentaromativorans]
MKIVKVFDLVGKNAISMQSGTKLHDAIYKSLMNDEFIELDFSGVLLYASPFFNASIGILLNDITIDRLTRNLKITNCSDVGIGLLNAVIQNALQFYGGDKTVSDTLNKHEKE